MRLRDRGITFLIMALALPWFPGRAAGQEPDYLSGGEVATIGAASLGILALGHNSTGITQTRFRIWTDPPAFDEAFTRWLAGEPKAGKRNFLDDEVGALASPLVAGALILAADLSYPAGKRNRDVAQNLFLFSSGGLVTKGFTDLVKGLVPRGRPLTHFAPEIVQADTIFDQEFWHRSFFSGHSAGAFYAMTFLNLHARGLMKREMSPDEFQRWGWISPVVTYGWASFVALSRVQAHRHYLTDVATGALAGILVGTLFHSLADDVGDSLDQPSGSSAILVGWSWSF